MKIDDLEAVEKEKFVYLTTIGRNTGKPHRVELWFAIGTNGVYLSHEGERTDWMRNAQKRGRVKVEIGGVKFDADAKLAISGEAREEGKRALYEKYYGSANKEVIDDWFSLSEVVQLKPV
jgi:deazaflavin-dependent oxidoreductase (nitroreductase family)